MSSLSSTHPRGGTVATTTLAGLIEAGPETLAPADPWLAAARGAAIVRAGELGLPSKTDEEWRHTNPAPLLDAAYALPERGLAMAAKCDDGASRAVEVLLSRLLARHAHAPDLADALRDLADRPLRDFGGVEVGRLRARLPG